MISTFCIKEFNSLVFYILNHNNTDIGDYCRNRDMIEIADIKLKHVCGEVFKKRLPKISDIRCGDWERYVLTDEQKKYAALDAWISWKLYHEGTFLELVNQRVSKHTVDNTFVAVYVKTSRQVLPSAFGYVEPMVDGNKYSTRLIRVVEVIVPGMIL